MGKKHLLLFVSCIIAVFACTGAWAVSMKHVAGDVKITRERKNLAADINMALKPGDLVSCGKNSLAIIGFADGSMVTMQENSKVKIGSSPDRKEESVMCLSGIVAGKFGKLVKGNTRKMYSPTTVCAIRGTEFTVAVSDSGETRVAMKEGRLDVRNPFGSAVLDEKSDALFPLEGSPEHRKDGGDLAKWRNARNDETRKKPMESADRMDRYLGKMKSSATEDSGSIGKLRDSMKVKGPRKKPGREELKKSGEELGRLEEKVDDDMMMSDAFNGSLSGIIDQFRKDRADIADRFTRVKEESNRVLEQQQENRKALRAVREAFDKARKEIMGKHREQKKKMKELMKDRLQPAE